MKRKPKRKRRPEAEQEAVVSATEQTGLVPALPETAEGSENQAKLGAKI